MAGSSPDDAHKRPESALQKKWLAWCALITFAGVMLFVNFLSVSGSIELASTSRSIDKFTRARMFLQERSLIHHYVQDEDGDDVLPPLLPPPHKWPLEEGMDEQCLYVRDYGLLERLDSSRQSFCTGEHGKSSPYTFYSVPESGLQATRFDNLTIDWRDAHVARDITSLAQDGMNHDPRFKYKHNATFCSCEEPQDRAHGAPYIWKNFVDGGPGENDTMCQDPPSELLSNNTLNVPRAILLSRKDDHNPFFQIAGILNAWIVMNVLGWSRTTTQLVTFDRAWPSPADELRHAVLGPERPIIDGETIQKRVIHFESVFFAPHEARGTLVNHLDIAQPCYANAMVSDFRDLALKSLDVRPRHEKTNPRRCLVTIISRRPYGGRAVQRVWQNESDILDRMREDYSVNENVSKLGGCEFQSLDFVNLTMHDQMRVMVDSDVVIGMHGAGMVNVLWTRPGTLVVEIFPKQKHRGGYRNICQFIGCAWHEFRGGEDVVVRSTDPNDLDKTIPYPEWKHFFDPLFQDVVARLAKSRLPQELQ